MDFMNELVSKLEDQKAKILDSIESKTKAIQTETSSKQVELDTEIKNLKDELSVVKGMLDKKGKSSTVSLPGLECEKDQFSFVKAMNYVAHGVASGDWGYAEKATGAGFEANVFKEARNKVNSIGVGSQGGFLVPTQVSNQLIEILLAKSVAVAAGATVIENIQGSPFEVPNQATDIVAYIVGENAAITESEATFGQYTMTPRSYAALCKMSKKSAMLTNPNLEQFYRNRMAEKIALRYDLAVLRGNGVGVESLGIVNTTGINTVAIGTNGGRFTFSTAQDMVTELENDNVEVAAGSFVAHPKTFNRMKKERIAQYNGDTSGSYVILPMTDQNLRDLLGYGYYKTTQLPTNLTKGNGTNLSEVIFGDFSNVWLGMWGGIELLASEHTSDAFAKNQVWVRAIKEMDCVVTRPTGFCLVNDATTQD
jgi:HK97 family phage major capsid protein